jgi:lysophospholipase L1-like esterase
LFCNENGYYAFYESDRFGFNNPDKIWDDNEFELVLLGDSFTQGSCVFEKNNLAGNLKKLEKKSNILNLGYNGNGPLKNLATLREYLQNKKIKKLLWIYYEGNDLEDLKNELKHLTLEQYFTNKTYSQKLKEKQIEIDQILRQKIIEEEKKYYKKESEKRLGEFKSFIKLNITRNVIINHLVGPKTVNEIEDLSNFSKILIEVKEYSGENNIEFIFVYLPEYKRYKKNLKLDNHRNYIHIVKLLNDLNIRNIDLVKEIEKRKIDPADLFPFKIISHIHYSELGYQILSDIIFQKINY